MSCFVWSLKSLFSRLSDDLVIWRDQLWCLESTDNKRSSRCCGLTLTERSFQQQIKTFLHLARRWVGCGEGVSLDASWQSSPQELSKRAWKDETKTNHRANPEGNQPRSQHIFFEERVHIYPYPRHPCSISTQYIKMQAGMPTTAPAAGNGEWQAGKRKKKWHHDFILRFTIILMKVTSLIASNEFYPLSV